MFNYICGVLSGIWLCLVLEPFWPYIWPNLVKLWNFTKKKLTPEKKDGDS